MNTQIVHLSRARTRLVKCVICRHDDEETLRYEVVRTFGYSTESTTFDADERPPDDEFRLDARLIRDRIRTIYCNRMLLCPGCRRLLNGTGDPDFDRLWDAGYYAYKAANFRIAMFLGVNENSVCESIPVRCFPEHFAVFDSLVDKYRNERGWAWQWCSCCAEHQDRLQMPDAWREAAIKHGLMPNPKLAKGSRKATRFFQTINVLSKCN